MSMSTRWSRRAGYVLWALVVAVAAILVPPAAMPAHGQRTVELTLGHGFSPEHHIHLGVLVPFAEELEERSGGRIRITIMPGGALASAADTYEAVTSGIMDIGWTLQSYTPGRFPLTEAVEVPFLFWENSEQPTRVLWELFQRHEGMQREYGEVKVLGLWSSDPRGIFTRERPVRTLADIRGQRIRALGGMEFAVMEAFGGVPVGIPAPGMYDALERGVIDGVSIGLSAVASYHLYDVVKHVTITNHGAGAQMLIMNMDTWNSLSPEDQTLIDELAGERLSLMGARQYDKDYQTGLDAINQHGVQIHYLPPEELEEWRLLTEPLALKGWLEANADKGARELYDLMLELASQL